MSLSMNNTDINKLLRAADKLIADSSESNKYYSVSELAKLSGYHKNMLRVYNSQGIIPIVSINGKDAIHAKYLEKLKVMRTLSKDYGINHAGIRYILGMFDKIDVSLSVEQKIEKYANLCGMKEDYVASRNETHARKYSK